MMRYRLLKDMKQGTQPFSSWQSKVRDQGERCDFDNYTKVMVARDSLLFNTLDTRLRKKVQAETMEFDAMIKLRLAYEHTHTKAEQMGDMKTKDTVVRRIIQDKVN